MDTRYLRDTYREYWTTVETKERTYYIENLLPQNETRDYRYIATIAEGLTPSRAIQNLARVSGEGIWEKDFNENELEEIAKAVILTKIAVNSDDYKSKEANTFDRDITLPDGSQLNVEYVPYIDENTDSILADMNQHLDIAE
jgi:hypothetical protein